MKFKATVRAILSKSREKFQGQINVFDSRFFQGQPLQILKFQGNFKGVLFNDFVLPKFLTFPNFLIMLKTERVFFLFLPTYSVKYSWKLCIIPFLKNLINFQKIKGCTKVKLWYVACYSRSNVGHFIAYIAIATVWFKRICKVVKSCFIKLRGCLLIKNNDSNFDEQ